MAPASAAGTNRMFVVRGSDPVFWPYTAAADVDVLELVPPTAPLAISGDAHQVVVTATTADHVFTATLRAPDGQSLQAGTTYPVDAAALVQDGARLDVRTEERSCQAGTSGSFTIDELGIDAGTGHATVIAARWTQYCVGSTGGATGGVYFDSVSTYLRPTEVHLTADGFMPGEPVALSGWTYDGVGRLASTTLHLSRTDASGTIALPDVVTAADGTFTASDILGTSDATYTVSYAGDSRRLPAHADAFVDEHLLGANLWFSSPNVYSLPPGSTVAFTGSLVDQRGQPMPGPLGFSRTDATGTHQLPDLVVDAQGQFTSSDVLGSSDATYDITYPGDATHEPFVDHRIIRSVQRVSEITVVPPVTATWGRAYTVSGVLTSETLPLVGTRVVLVRKDLSGSHSFAVRTDAAGRYAYRDSAQIGGIVTWTATYAGSTSTASSTASVSMGVARFATTITGSTDRAVYPMGGLMRLVVHLGTTYNNRYVNVWATPVGTGTRTLIAHVRVDSHGNAVVSTYRVRRRTLLELRFEGDYRYNWARRWLWVTAATNVVGRPSNSSYTSLSGGVFHLNTTTPIIKFTTVPTRTSGCVYATIEPWQNGRWGTGLISCLTLDATGWAYGKVFPPLVPGVLYRARGWVKTDSVSYAGTSPWMYVKYG